MGKTASTRMAIVSNPQRIATNLDHFYVIVAWALFQTLKGSLQTLFSVPPTAPGTAVSNPQRIATNYRQRSLLTAQRACFKPSKDRYKLHLSVRIVFKPESFKPSKDRYKQYSVRSST